MKKIGLITYHGADNFGSLLQAYALLKVLQKHISSNTEIINFVSKEQKQMYSLFLPNNSIKNLIKNMYILFNHYDIRKAKAVKFEEFREKYLNSSKKDSFDSISCDNIKGYDAFVCGSDQIWNMHIDDFYDYYMLSFGKKEKKISYAASMGGLMPKLTEADKDKIQKLVSDFAAISVRENMAYSIVKECTGREANVNIDPVFLIERNKWDEIAGERIMNEDYIFFYSIDYNDDSVEIAKWFSKKYNLPVVILNTSWKSYVICKDGIQWAKSQGIEDFLSLVKYAKIVLSGSFHGTAFSVIYNKPFFRIQRRNNGEFLVDDRVRTLFQKLQITEREINIENYEEYAEKVYDVDYSNINKMIEKERANSIEYLREALLTEVGEE